MLGGLLLLLGSCAPQKKANDPNAIDIAASLEHLTELKISQLGKQIRYIPLETTDSSLIGNSYSCLLYTSIAINATITDNTIFFISFVIFKLNFLPIDSR